MPARPASASSAAREARPEPSLGEPTGLDTVWRADDRDDAPDTGFAAAFDDEDPGPFGEVADTPAAGAGRADPSAGRADVDAADDMSSAAVDDDGSDEAAAAAAVASELVARVALAAADDPLPFDGDWPDFAATLPVSGLARQFALQSECVGWAEDTLRLRVPIRPLADPALVAKVRDAIAARLDRSLRLEVTVGAVGGRTAAAAASARDAESLRVATAAIEDDPFVRALVDRFGGAIVPGSVRPLNANDAGSRPPEEPQS